MSRYNQWMRKGLLLFLIAWSAGSTWTSAQAAINPAAEAAAEDVVTFRQAELLIAAESTPPQTQQGWQSVTLPDAWPAERYAIGDNGWYRFTITRKNPPVAQWGIYLPRLNMNAAVYFNGELLGDGGSFEQPLGRNWSRPMYFKIPNGLWKAGDNLMEIRLRSDVGVGVLAPVVMGEHTLLSPRFERAYFIQIHLTASLFIVTLGTSLFFFGIWIRRRNDSQYGWFALTAFFWSFFSLNNSIHTLPVSAFTWDWLIFSSIAWWTTSLAIFVHRYVGVRQARIETVLIGYAVLAMLLYVIAGDYLWIVSGIWTVGGIISGVYTVGRLLVYSHGIRRGGIFAAEEKPPATSGEATTLALGITVVLVIGVQDWLVQNGFFYGLGEEYAHHHFLAYSAPLLIMFIAWHLNRRFIGALSESEQLNTQLEARVAVNRHELEISHLKLRELERNRVLMAERDRIFRDLHDGLGGITTNISLLSNLAQQEESAQVIKQKLATISGLSQEGMDEIRGFMRELDNTNADWQSVTADLRVSGSNLLEPHDIEFHFDVKLENDEEVVDSALRLNLFRIHKEVLMNVIKHAQAKSVSVHIEVTSQELLLDIKDDGIGLINLNDVIRVSSGNAGGHGLGNLKVRAQRLGGTLTLHSEQGTRVCLQVPLPIKYPESGMVQ